LALVGLGYLQIPAMMTLKEKTDQATLDLEIQAIKDALKRNETLNEAARELDVDRTTLWRKMKKYGIPGPKQRAKST
jgi:transcriptional regulator with PAS, ATPase and Fis domain